MWKNDKPLGTAIELLRQSTEQLVQVSQAAITEVRSDLARLRERVDRQEERQRDLEHQLNLTRTTLAAEMRKPLAEAEALLNKADARFRAARSSEERSRRYAHEARDVDDEGIFDDEDSEGERDVGGGGGSERLPAVHSPEPDRAPVDPVAAARAAKWNR